MMSCSIFTFSGVLGTFFDFVDDAFSGRSPSLPSETDSVGSRSISVAEASSNMSETFSRSSSAASVTSPDSE